MTTGAPLLEVEGLAKHFRGLVAVKNVTFDVKEGEIRGLIGPNGAGKTTCFNMVTGFLRPTRGAIRFRGQAIESDPPHAIARAGVVRTFQHTTVFPNLSVEDNLLFGRYLNDRRTPWSAFWGLPGYGKARQDNAKHIDRVLRLLGIAERRNTKAADLAYGEQRYLEIALALMANPRLLLLDEPAAGLNPQESEKLMALVQRLRAEGLTIVLIEHNMDLVMSCCDRIVVLNFGEVIADGPPADVQANPKVIEVYLGSGTASFLA